MNKQVLMMSCALGALALSASGAYAAAAANTAAGATAVGEIIVTAEKRAANIQDVPEAVTAFTSEERNIVGINTVQDMTDFTPGLTYSSQLDRPAMRGLARNNNIYLSDSAVAVYYDDFYSNSTFLVGRDDMLIDQVEVLLGPQGTLYGRNAIGGLINTISKRPTDVLSGEFRAIAGNYGYTKLEGTVAGPITDHLSFRLSAYDLNQTRGYFNNLVPGAPSEGEVRHDPYFDAQLEWKDDRNDLWVDAYTLTFNGDRGGPGALLGTPTAGPYDTALTSTSNGLFFNPNFPYGGGAVPGSVVGMIPGANNPALGNIRNFAHSVSTNIDVDAAYAITFHYVHHFDGFDIKYVGGYSQYHYDLHTSYFNGDNSSITQYQIPLNPPGANGLCAAGYLGPCGPLTVDPSQIFQYDTHTAWYSHELTLSSTTNSPLQYIAGAYFYNETDNNPETFQSPGQAQVGSPILFNALVTGHGFVPAIANPSRDFLLLDYQDRIRSYAAYGQLDWKITPTIKLTGGLRYTYDEKQGVEETRYIDFSSGILNPASFGSSTPAVDISTLEISPTGTGTAALAKGVTCAATLQTTGSFAGDWTRCLGDHSSAVTGTAGIEFTPDHDTLVYARYNRGYKAFGLNAGFVGPGPEALPETVDDFELGFKKTFGHTLTLDADAFYYNYVNDQVPIGVPLGSINVVEFINIPKAVSDGIELTANWRPVDHLNMTLTYGFDHTSIRSGCTAVGGVATGACYVDVLDPGAQAIGARPVGSTGLQAVSGDELPQAPENKLAFNANYTWEFERGNLSLSGTFIWKDKSYGSIFTRTYDEAPSWDQVDLRAIWAGKDDRYEVVLYVKNLFNSLGYDSASAGYPINAPVGGGPATQASSYDLTPPRLYGMELHFKF